MQEVQIYSDGSCLGNPGPGGWAAIIRMNGEEKELSGGLPHTTNNIMELTAALEPVKSLTVSSHVTIVTDSEYLVKGMTQWLAGWIRKGWKTAGGKPVKNRELWEALHAHTRPHRIDWVWIRGHAGHPENERCDRLARSTAETFKTGR